MSLHLYVGPDAQPDKYRLVRSVGRGGEATLYLAEVTLAGQTEPVVVKVLNSDVTANEEQFAELSARWGEQAELLRFINRLGVVGVREYFEGAPEHPAEGSGEYTDRALYLVMNYVQGVDLRDWRAEHAVEGPRGQREALRHLEQVALVLDVLHSGRATPSKRVVVHGDLSPGNIMISDEGQATLVDFGLSRIAARHMTARPWFTPGYAAPEIFTGEYSAATDRYAFGAIAYFTLTGEDPPPAPEQLRERFGALPLVANAGERQRELVMAMFSAEPGARPEAADWIRALRSLATSAPWTGPASDPGDAVPAAAVTETPHGGVEPSAPEPSAGDASGAPEGRAAVPSAGDPAAEGAAPPQGARFSGPPPVSAPAGGPPAQQERPGAVGPSAPPEAPAAQGPAPSGSPSVPSVPDADDMPPRPVGGLRGAPQAAPGPQRSRAAQPSTSGPRGAGQGTASRGPGRTGPQPGQPPRGPHPGAPAQGMPNRPPSAGGAQPGSGARSGPVPPPHRATAGPRPGWSVPPHPDATGAFAPAAHVSAGAAAPARRKSRKPKLIGLAVVIVLAMLAGSAGTYYVMVRTASATAAAGEPDGAGTGDPEPSGNAGSTAPEPVGEETGPVPGDADSGGGGASDAPNGGDTTLLTQVVPVDQEGSWEPETGRAQVDGQVYTRALAPGSCAESEYTECTGWVDYDLGRNWTTFTALIGVQDDSRADAATTFIVNVDGEPELTETLGLGEPLEIEVDVRNALRLRIEVESDDYSVHPVWADPALARD
ncbi:protein kinase [Nocardiopsis sp. NPDC101807]|uniref:protein kinase domain-containing protein n=1 Tax=Nocardiopsis sp. NPDC101807 TaxID=3364339 RepID=UPI003811E609